MRYIPITDDDRRRMLEAIGAKTIEELFSEIPEAIRLNQKLALPEPMSELELMRTMRALAGENADPYRTTSFLGAGSYRHFSPAAVHQTLLRGEFLTAYTPYQPELSQGTLQALYEFQTLIATLTGMDVANGSLYEGATATAEAVLMARRINQRKRVLVSAGLHPDYHAVLQTYTGSVGTTLMRLPLAKDGATDFNLRSCTPDDLSAVVVQYPNFYGAVERLDAARAYANQADALLIVVITEPLALGVLKTPGACGADIVAGEGQAFGLPIGYGGPYLGLFATKQEYLRQIPGRLVGKTQDIDGKDGYVITLATREQHIRREKATSNICTNETLLAIGATIYLSLLGKEGLRELALHNVSKARYARETIAALPSYEIPYSAPVFNEFLVRSKGKPAREILARLRNRNVLGGVPLAQWHKNRGHDFLVCVTELNTCAEIDELARGLSEAQQ